MLIDQEKLAKAFAALWIFIAIPISQDVYDLAFEGGLLMRIFSLALVAAPVWLVFGWRWLTNKMPIPFKYICLIPVFGVITSIIFTNSYNYDELAYVPLVLALAFLGMVWIYERGAMLFNIKKVIKGTAKASPPQKSLERMAYILKDGLRLRDITERLQKELLKQLNVDNVSQNVKRLISPSVDAYLACYGLIHFYFSTLSNYEREKLSESFSFYRLEIRTIIAVEKAEHLEKMLSEDVKSSGDLPVLEDAVKNIEYRKSIEDLMSIFEDRARSIKAIGSYYPLYENLKVYSSKIATEEALRNQWESFFSRLYNELEMEISNYSKNLK